MTKQKQIYRCEICGNIVEVLHEAPGELVCCGQPMKFLQEKTQEQEPNKREKHVPVIKGNKVKVGSVEHPMTEEHHIEFIEATSEKGEKSIVFLKPGQKPEAEFCFTPSNAREYCNLHGLWKV